MTQLAPLNVLPGGMTQSDVIGLLGLTANQVGWFGDLSAFPGIDAYIRGQSMPIRGEDFTDSFKHGMKLAFGGTCADRTPAGFVNITDGRFDRFVRETVTGLKPHLSAIMFGGTYWAWMPELARAAVEGARVPIMGVMPVQGLADLKAVEHLFRGDKPVPKMHYLAIAGSTYDDFFYTSFLASSADGLVVIGGRDGAKNEVRAFLNAEKPVFLAPVKLPSDQDWLADQVYAGLTYPRDTMTLVQMLGHDFKPHEKMAGGSGLSFREHINTSEFRARHARDIVIGVVSTSGATTDTHRLGRITDPLFAGINNKRWHDGSGQHKAVLLGGMTAMGGIHRAYASALKAKIAAAGIMTWNGADCDLVRGVREMIIVGDQWGQESDDFVDLIDVMLVLGPPPGRQGWTEAVRAIAKGKPTVILQDQFLAPDRLPVEEGAQHVHFFGSHQIDLGVQALNLAIDEVLRRRKRI